MQGFHRLKVLHFVRYLFMLLLYIFYESNRKCDNLFKRMFLCTSCSQNCFAIAANSHLLSARDKETVTRNIFLFVYFPLA